MVIDPHSMLIQAIAHARSVGPQPMPNYPLDIGGGIHPQVIHQIASQLASHIAGSRSALGQAHMGMFPGNVPSPPQQRYPAVPENAPPPNVNPNPYGVGYAPNGIPGDWMPAADNNGATDNAFFVRPAPRQWSPDMIVRPGSGALLS